MKKTFEKAEEIHENYFRKDAILQQMVLKHDL